VRPQSLKAAVQRSAVAPTPIIARYPLNDRYGSIVLKKADGRFCVQHPFAVAPSGRTNDLSSAPTLKHACQQSGAEAVALTFSTLSVESGH